MNEDDIVMEIDESEEISLSPCASRTSINDSPASPMPQGKSQLKNASDSDGDSKIELEEGEIDSDVSSSPDHSRRKDSDRNLLKQRTHKKYSSNSDISDGSSDEDRPASKRGSAHGSESERGNNARVVKVKNAAERESRMSDDDDDDVKMISGSDEDVSEDEKASQNVKEDRRSDDEVGDGKDETSESSSEESAEENESKTEKKTKKQKEVQDESDIESSAGEDSDSVNSEESDEEIGKEKKDATSSESESESDAEGIAKPSEDKSKSLSFKKSNQKGEKETSSKLASGSHKHSDHDSDNDVIDHLEIAAPQQALLRATKKKSSKEKSRDRSGGKDGRESSKNRDKKDNLRYKEKDRRDNKSKEYYDKKSLKYKERRYDAYEHKTDKDSGKRSKSSVEKKSKTLVEEDLRKKLLQKRSTRDDVSGRVKKDQRDYKDKNRRDEKNNQEKGEKRRDEKISKSRKEEKEKSSEVSVTKSSKNPKENDNSKDVKGIRSSKEKSPKGSNSDKSKKRRREKTKTEVKKKKNHSGEESSDDDEKDAKKPATKRPRSAEVETEGKADVSGDKNEEEKDHNKEYSYDDISPVSSEELSPPPSPVELKKPTYYPAIMGCRDVIKEFQWLNKIEEGTYGVVYRARDNRTDEIVALKRLKMEKEKEGFPITSLREINTLLKAQHPNIVTVREIVVGSNMDKIYIVMDYVEHDLKALMETMTQPFLVGEVKTLMMQLLRGVQHLHDNWILHRDIKASNLLLSHKGILKIGDFGLAREYGSPLKQYTSIVVTLWYRAPELLLGGKMYATAVDIWSVGCVFAELLTMKPLFPGKSEIDQINRIFKELGTPNDKIWPGPPSYSEYPLVKKTNFANHPYNILRQKFGATLTDKGFNLLNRLLTYDPAKRITADAALEHEFFGESPLPVDPSMFPTWPAKSELGHRAVRKHNASPKAPEGGAAASKVANEDSHLGFHMPAATKGYSAKGAGFNLKF